MNSGVSNSEILGCLIWKPGVSKMEILGCLIWKPGVSNVETSDHVDHVDHVDPVIFTQPYSKGHLAKKMEKKMRGTRREKKG